MVMFKKSKQTSIRKIRNLQWIGIVVIKSKEARVITYTSRYSSGYLIPIIQLCQDELSTVGIKFPLVRISAGIGDHLCFLTFYNFDPY